MHSFSDFAKPSNIMVGDKVKIGDIVGVDICVLGYEIGPSKFKPEEDYLKLQFQIGDKEHVLFTGSKVLQKQCEDYSDKMPFKARIEKVNNYFTFQ